jgi:hypothetical protein
MKTREIQLSLVATRSLSQGPRQNCWWSTTKTDPNPTLCCAHVQAGHGTFTNIHDIRQFVNPPVRKRPADTTRARVCARGRHTHSFEGPAGEWGWVGLSGSSTWRGGSQMVGLTLCAEYRRTRPLLSAESEQRPPRKEARRWQSTSIISAHRASGIAAGPTGRPPCAHPHEPLPYYDDHSRTGQVWIGICVGVPQASQSTRHHLPDTHSKSTPSRTPRGRVRARPRPLSPR